MYHRHWPPALWLTRLAASLGTLVIALFAGASANAAVYTFSTDVPVTLSGSGITVTIVSGSLANVFDIQANTLSVTVGSGESFTIRYPGPGAGDLANNGGLSTCNVVGSSNDVTVAGPATVTFTPTATPVCGNAAVSGGSGGGGSASSAPATVTLGQPNGGEALVAGTKKDVFWSGSGGITSVRLLLSLDGGLTYATVAEGEANDGFYSWTVPSTATAKARFKIEAVVLGGVVGASDASDADFAILPANAVEPAPTIDADKELPLAPASACVAGTLVKVATNAAVYYCGKDGKRYVFPNKETYFSWYPDFTGVITLAPDVMAAIRIGGNVTFKPGTLVKIQSDPKVYLVSKGGKLRWVTSESAAITLFGTEWAKMVHDVPDSFFLNYVIGEPLQ